jgi:hypothetical protein
VLYRRGHRRPSNAEAPYAQWYNATNIHNVRRPLIHCTQATRDAVRIFSILSARFCLLCSPPVRSQGADGSVQTNRVWACRPLSASPTRVSALRCKGSAEVAQSVVPDSCVVAVDGLTRNALTENVVAIIFVIHVRAKKSAASCTVPFENAVDRERRHGGPSDTAPFATAAVDTRRLLRR